MPLLSECGVQAQPQKGWPHTGVHARVPRTAGSDLQHSQAMRRTLPPLPVFVALTEHAGLGSE